MRIQINNYNKFKSIIRKTKIKKKIRQCCNKNGIFGILILYILNIFQHVHAFSKYFAEAKKIK